MLDNKNVISSAMLSEIGQIWYGRLRCLSLNNMLNVPYSFRPRDMHVSNGETTTTSAVVEDMRVRCRRITAFSVSTRPWASRTKSVPISVFSILCAPQNKFGAGLDEERTSDNHHCIYVEH
jgi:hypothetical protein